MAGLAAKAWFIVDGGSVAYYTLIIIRENCLSFSWTRNNRLGKNASLCKKKKTVPFFKEYFQQANTFLPYQITSPRPTSDCASLSF